MDTTLTQEQMDRIRASFECQNLMNLYNAEATAITPGNFEITLKSQPSLLRSSGVFNGGVLAALADTAAGYAAITLKGPDPYFVTVELKINYLNPALGDTLFARAQVLKDGKTLSVAKTDLIALRDSKETLAATALVTLMEIKK